jgi:hypothetical protein
MVIIRVIIIIFGHGSQIIEIESTTHFNCFSLIADPEREYGLNSKVTDFN